MPPPKKNKMKEFPTEDFSDEEQAIQEHHNGDYGALANVAIERHSPKPKYWFLVEKAPKEGGAPQEIKEQWIGVLLPSYCDRPLEAPDQWKGIDSVTGMPEIVADCVRIPKGEAIKALEQAGKTKAGLWWKTHGSSIYGELIFNINDGQLMPPQERDRRFAN